MQGPFLPSDAVQDKLVDRLAYWDQVQDYFKCRYRGWNPISLNRYRGFREGRTMGRAKIAVVHATGLIVSGESQTTPGGGFRDGRRFCGADIRDARTDSTAFAPSCCALIRAVAPSWAAK